MPHWCANDRWCTQPESALPHLQLHRVAGGCSTRVLITSAGLAPLVTTSGPGTGRTVWTPTTSFPQKCQASRCLLLAQPGDHSKSRRGTAAVLLSGPGWVTPAGAVGR
eukprot:766456-Hanusia_phi.AAC.4